MKGFGTAFTWNGQPLSGKTTVGFPKMSAESIDKTTHESADEYAEFMAGMRDAGTLALSGYFKYDDTNGQIAMLSDFASGTTREWTATLPNSIAVWTGNGFLTKWEMGDAPIRGLIPWTAEIKVTGKPTLAVATSTGLTPPFFAVSESGTISPNPAGDVYEYVVNFLTGVASFTITPTAAAGTIEIEANGAKQTVASGQASSAITLGEADSFIDVKIKVTETNKAPVVYTLHCCRA
jgi:predicted secreted protein